VFLGHALQLATALWQIDVQRERLGSTRNLSSRSRACAGVNRRPLSSPVR
jgi:hypothetical protein